MNTLLRRSLKQEAYSNNRTFGSKTAQSSMDAVETTFALFQKNKNKIQRERIMRKKKKKKKKNAKNGQKRLFR